MDAPLHSPHDLIRPWRRATLVASGIAAIELVLLVGAGALLVAKPLAHALRNHAQATATAAARTPAPTKQAEQAIKHQAAPAGKARPRNHVRIMVFNGNGHAGAAGRAASTLHGLGWVIAGTANARRQDYATSVVMYRPGYRAEGVRLARDLHAKVVAPLDGIRPSALDGGELAVILGA